MGLMSDAIFLDIYHYSNWSEKKGFLPGRKNPTTLSELKGVGGGGFEISRSDPKLLKDPTLLQGRNICKLRIGTEVVGAFLFGDRESTITTPQERSELTYKLAGPGLKQLFDDARIEAYGGTKPLSSSTRYFNFASERGAWYDESKWVNPYDLGKWNSGQIWIHFPEKWPAIGYDSHWIGPESYNLAMPEGVWYIRHEFNVATSGSYVVYSGVDDLYDLYIDGQHLSSTKEGGGWMDTSRLEVELLAGNHTLAYRVTNGTGPSAVLMVLARINDDESETPITRSGTGTWKMLYYPERAPGWSPGEVLGDLMDEAEARGVIFPSLFNRTFTESHDSNGVPWPDSSLIDWSFKVGDSLLSVVTRLEETTVDIWVDPDTFDLHMIPQRGVDRTGFTFSQTGAALQVPVELKLGKHLRSAGTKSKSKIKNNLLMKTVEGFFESEDATSVGKYGRLEATLDTGASSTLAQEIAAMLFTQRAQEEEGASYDLILLDYQPFVDFDLGDWILAPNEQGKSVKRRVMSISVNENDQGQPLYTIEFDTIFRDNEDRINRVLDKLGGGGIGSSSPNTQGSTPGVGEPVIIPPTSPDPGNAPAQVAKAPTDLTVESLGSWSPNGVNPISIVTLDWTAVTQDIDDQPMTPLYYNVEGQLFIVETDENDDDILVEVAGPVNFGDVTTDEVILQPFEPGDIWKFRVRAGDGVTWSDWSSAVFHEMVGPTEPMMAPTAPSVSSSRGTMTVEWDGTMGDYQPPPQFRYVYAEVASDPVGPWRRVGSVLFRKGGAITVPQFSVGVMLWVRLVAVDGVGIESPPSASVSHIIQGITGPDIQANSVDANVIIAGSIQTNHLSPEVGSQLNIEGNVTIVSAKEQINGVATDLEATSDNLAEMQTYYDFGPQGAVISSPGSVFATAVRNDRIEMLENGNVISYWNSGQMYVDQLIGQRVTLGRHQIEQFDANGTVVRAL